MFDEARRRVGNVAERLNFRGKRKDEQEPEPIFQFEGDGTAQNPYTITVEQLIETAEKAGWRTKDGATNMDSLSLWLGEAMREAVFFQKDYDPKTIYLKLCCQAAITHRPSLQLHLIWGRVKENSRLSGSDIEFQCNFAIPTDLQSFQVHDINVFVDGRPYTQVAMLPEYVTGIQSQLVHSEITFQQVVHNALNYARDREIPIYAEYERGRPTDPFQYEMATFEQGMLQVRQETETPLERQYRKLEGELSAREQDKKALTDWLNSAVDGNLPETYLQVRIRKLPADFQRAINIREQKSLVPGMGVARKAIKKMFRGVKLIESETHRWPGKLQELVLWCRAKTVESHSERNKPNPIQIEILFFADRQSAAALQGEEGELDRWAMDPNPEKKEAEVTRFQEFLEKIRADLPDFVNALVEPERRRLEKQGRTILYPKIVDWKKQN